MRLTTYNYDHRLQLSTDQTISTAAKRPYQRARNQIYTLLNQLSHQVIMRVRRGYLSDANVALCHGHDRHHRSQARRLLVLGGGRRRPPPPGPGSLKRQSGQKLLAESHSTPTMHSPWNVCAHGLVPSRHTARAAGIIAIAARGHRRLRQASDGAALLEA